MHQAGLDADTIVIGGGPAGAGAAIALAQRGQSVLLIERQQGPHDKVCGGFLSHEAIASLRRLGVDPAALGARPISRLALFAGPRPTLTPLPFQAMGISRRTLDEALLARAARLGVELRRGLRAVDVGPIGGRWAVSLANGGRLIGQRVLLATGKHDLKTWKRPAGRQADLIGFQMAFALPLQTASALDGTVELHLFDGGYAGLEPSDGARANLCLVVTEGAYRANGGAWPDLLAAIRRQCPGLAERLDGAVADADRPCAIAAIPYGYVARVSDGVWRLGDQAAVIPSFAGEGMAIALHSAELAADFAASDRGAAPFQAALARHVGLRVAAATTLSQALVRPAGRKLAAAALAIAPGLADLVARHTRLPASAQTALRHHGRVQSVSLKA